jgi:molybdenum cofactor biosynthesis enzyme MoaA
MLAVALGFSCNNACVFCAQGELRATRPTEDVALRGRVEAALAAIAPGQAIAFTGGEPTLHAALPAWIAAADARGASSILVQTNGRRLAYRAYARELAAASSRLRLEVSLHGSTEAMHDHHTASPGSFKQTVAGLANARAEGTPVAIATVVTRSNFRHLVDIVRIAAAARAQSIQLAAAEPHGRAAADAARVIASPAMVRPHLEAAVAEARRLGLTVAAGAAGAEGHAGLGEVEPAVIRTTARAASAPTLVSRDRIIARARGAQESPR